MRFRPDIRVGTRMTYVKTIANGNQIIVDYYVQRVSHAYSAIQGGSRTTLDLVRGLQRDGVSVEPFRQSHLFWTHEGGSLDPNPYEVVISEDVFGVVGGPISVPNTDVIPLEGETP
jgi:hypothetical protein